MISPLISLLISASVMLSCIKLIGDLWFTPRKCKPTAAHFTQQLSRCAAEVGRRDLNFSPDIFFFHYFSCAEVTQMPSVLLRRDVGRPWLLSTYSYHAGPREPEAENNGLHVLMSLHWRLFWSRSGEAVLSQSETLRLFGVIFSFCLRIRQTQVKLVRTVVLKV